MRLLLNERANIGKIHSQTQSLLLHTDGGRESYLIYSSYTRETPSCYTNSATSSLPAPVKRSIELQHWPQAELGEYEHQTPLCGQRGMGRKPRFSKRVKAKLKAYLSVQRCGNRMRCVRNIIQFLGTASPNLVSLRHSLYINLLPVNTLF
jgi:hypothetical protein